MITGGELLRLSDSRASAKGYWTLIVSAETLYKPVAPGKISNFRLLGVNTGCLRNSVSMMVLICHVYSYLNHLNEFVDFLN